MESIWTGKYRDYFLQCMLIVDRLERLSVTKEEFLILKALVNTIVKCYHQYDQRMHYCPIMMIRIINMFLKTR